MPDSLRQNDDLAARWETLLRVRADVNKALENAKVGGAVKKSLEAKVTLYGAADDTAGFDDEMLETYLLVSQVVRVDDGRQGIAVEPADGSKCVRCWLIRRDIGVDPAHKEICGRCAAAVGEIGNLAAA